MVVNRGLPRQVTLQAVVCVPSCGGDFVDFGHVAVCSLGRCGRCCPDWDSGPGRRGPGRYPGEVAKSVAEQPQKRAPETGATLPPGPINNWLRSCPGWRHPTQLKKVKPAVAGEIGGIVLFGTPPANLAKKIAGLRAVARAGGCWFPVTKRVAMFQRMATLIGKMPSAKTIGQTKTPEQTRALAVQVRQAKRRWHRHGSCAGRGSFYPGSWTDTYGRAFKSNRSATACA